jgi:hypothetical protein
MTDNRNVDEIDAALFAWCEHEHSRVIACTPCRKAFLDRLRASRSSPAREPRADDALTRAHTTLLAMADAVSAIRARHGRSETVDAAEHLGHAARALILEDRASPPPAREPEGLRERVEALAKEWETEADRRDRDADGSPSGVPRVKLRTGASFERAHAEALRSALASPGTPAADPGPGDLIDRCRKAVVVLRDILRHSPMREGVAVADQLLADLAALSPETTRQVLAALVRRANGPCHNMLGFCSTHDQPIGKCLASPSPGEDAATTDRDRLALMAQAAEFWIAMGEGREESRWDVEASRALVMCGKSLLAMLRIPLEEVARRLALTWPPAKFAAPSSSTPSTPAKEK